MSDTLLGYCGLNCQGCGVYQATKAGEPLKDDSGSPMICEGCNSAKTTVWCTDCAIKNCARERTLRVCIDCRDNPCEKMTGFMNDPKYPYHLRVQDDMRRLKETGLEKWTADMKARYICPGCSSTYNWFETTCGKCGTVLDA